MAATWEDTIAAVSSPLGPSARGIIRVSGPEAWAAVSRVVASPNLAGKPPPSEAAVMRALLRAADIRHAWPGTVFYWPGGRSYTGQTCVEIHTWGGPVLLEACLAGLGVRPAKPGEFTMRAFLAGRIDLAQAEAVAAVIAAGNDEELAAALKQLAGGIRRPLQAVREDLINLLAELEAGLDFAEEDISFLPRDEAQRRLGRARDELRRISARLRSREDARRGYRVVLCGRPNAGKSSLFNAILEGEKAIVSDLPGTTRDYLAAETEQRGIPIILIDTAGDEDLAPPDSQDSAISTLSPHGSARGVETQPRVDALRAEAARAAWETMRAADLLVFCADCRWELTVQERRFLAAVRDRCLVAATKCDLAATGFSNPLQPDVCTSAATREGVDQLRAMIVRRLAERGTSRGDLPSTSADTQRCLLSAISALEEALERLGHCLAEEYVAASVRAALDALGEIVGAVYTEDILDRVFSRFCIGK
ncbi:MAG: tRNA modification GTPase [Thermogutta sp.]|nr:tRNA modification GTPase [Thermogutta sp.]